MRPCNHGECAYQTGCMYANCTHASRCGGGVCVAPAKPETTEADFTTKADISYLREGDRILVNKNNSDLYRLAVATMDGHAVSDTYGLRAGNDYYAKNVDRNYINVRFDGVEYGTPHSWKHPNDSVYAKDNTVYVTAATAARIRRDKSETQRVNRLIVDRKKAAELMEKMRADAAELMRIQARINQADRDYQEV